jgi:hypothetical protein
MIEQPDLLAERLAPLANPLDDSDWLDVRRRARTMRRSWLLIPVAAAIAVILAGSAFALYGELVDFISAEPAPDRVVVQFGQMDARGSIGFGPRVKAGEARRITEATIEGKRRTLYVAPTPDGGFCWMWTTVSGSCGRTQVAPGREAVSASWRESRGGGPALLTGRILDPAVTRVLLEYENGERSEISFVWVSKPIDAGFFIFEVPAEHLQVGKRGRTLLSIDKDGRELAAQTFPITDQRWESGPDGLPRIADRSRKRTLFDFRDHRGAQWTLVVAPAPGDRTCFAYQRGGGCVSPKHPPIIGGMGVQPGEAVNICCAVAKGVEKVELRYEDGENTDLTPRDGFLLYVIPPNHYPRGHRLQAIVWQDGGGRELASRKIKTDQPGVYPCDEGAKIDLGYGATVCP